MKILVLCEAYPEKTKPYQLMYVHTRVREYLKQGLDVTVLSFRANDDYEIDGVQVKKEQRLNAGDFDLVISHAPNIRNHIRYIFRYLKKSQIVFFIHGHEALDVTKYYPGRYDGTKYPISRKCLEVIKLTCLRLFLNQFSKQIHMIYVSKWMKRHFYKNVKFKKAFLSENIIANSVNECYVSASWDRESEKKFDYITIRPLNEKKYAVDVVLEYAKANPSKLFALYGEGNIFEYIEKPENVIHFEKFLFENEIVKVLNMSKAAFMPTRLDAQGVMVCEMATFGIPTVTSNIDVCKEIFSEIDNVALIDNESIQPLPDFEQTKFVKNLKYCSENTINREIKLINDLKRNEDLT
ncbi:glycosyltransferase [Paraglaciecola chathamensis]|uniref:Glycosyl transferase family 1 domain-containing protein n=1 Tax=Paraglaciecola chathamensis S18K6 TaxID=1127672 RepID=A0AAV3UXL6_9ALTE|nr:glycosyltransferase [Paraglaciecola chathamensis]GAC10539.1 hypothetical protein GCHA_2592 [Paraglaciecola chathamensis S18K6]